MIQTNRSVLGATMRLICVVVAMLCLTGCVSKKKLVLFQDADDYAEAKRIASTYDIRIQPDDQLAIAVASAVTDDKNESPLIDLFNNKVYIGGTGNMGGNMGGNMSGNMGGNGSGNGGMGGNTLSGFHVDKDGYIDFPVFGKIYVAGLSRKAVADTIQNRLHGGYINDAVVTVELLSFRVIVIGAVGSETILNIGKDRCTIVEAMTMAGDFSIDGFRHNVLVVREENGEISSYRVNFTSLGDLLNSPVYYLQQNDIVYVEPNGAIRVEASPGYRYMTAITTVTSFFMSLATLVVVLIK